MLNITNSDSQFQNISSINKVNNHDLQKNKADKSAPMFKIEKFCIVSNPYPLMNNKLITEIALYRLMFKKYPISIQLLVQNLILGANSAGFQLTYNKNQLLDLFIIDQKVLDSQIAQRCCQSLIHLIKQTNVSYKFQKSLISDKMLTPFLFLLNFNRDYAFLIDDDQQDKLVDYRNFSAIFQCSLQTLISLNQVYEQNYKKIIQPFAIHYLLYQFVAIKLKSKISQRIKIGCWIFNEGSIQLSQAQILKYYIIKQQEEDKNTDLKQNFSILCRNVINLSELNYSRKQKLRNQLKKLSEQNKSEEQLLQDIKKISLEFNVKENLIVSQFKRIKNGTGNIMEMQPIRYQRIVQYFNYIRYKEYHESIKDISQNISQKYKQAKKYIDQLFQPQFKRNYQIEEKNYLKIVLNAIKRHLIKDEVLFVDCHVFYRKQLILYSLLSKKEVQYAKEIYYEPHLDVISQYILGVTSTRILFKKRLAQPNNLQRYLQDMTDALNTYKKTFQRVIVIYISFSLQKSQWLILNSLISRMNNLGKQVFLLPVKKYIPNTIQFIKFCLKIELFSQLELSSFSGLTLQSFEQRIDAILKRINRKKKISEITACLWKDFNNLNQ